MYVRPQQLVSCVGQDDQAPPCEVDGVEGFHCDQEVCIPGECGDGVLDSTEECDDGSASSDTTPDACRSTCRLPRCGDGIVDPSNREACDDGLENADDSPDACRLSCQVPRCGDGVTDAGEVCDDGNPDLTDDCTPDCTFDVTGCGGYCGDGARNGDEVCDDLDFDGQTCRDFASPGVGNYQAGTLSCSSDCASIATTHCAEDRGDGERNGVETCDGSDLGGNSYAGFGYYTGSPSGEVFAVGRFGTILRYDGSSWSKSDNSTVEGLYGVGGSSASDIFAVGNAGRILRYEGNAWIRMASSSALELDGVWGNSSSDFFVVGYAGSIHHWDGVSWTAMLAPDSHLSLHDVWGAPAGAVSAVGDHGTLLELRQPMPTLAGGACDAPIPLYCAPTFDADHGSNGVGRTAAFDDYGATAACPGARPTTGNEVFHRLDCPITGEVTVRLTPADADLDLIVVRADENAPQKGCDPTHCVAASQSTGTTLEQVTFNATQHRTYYAVVDGYADAVSGYELEIRCVKD